MRATPKNRKLDENAQVGIGTMIVFIATVLVAAVAAGVLIDMSGKLQEKSSRTGSEATQKVSSNFDITSVVGKRDNTSAAGLDDLQVFIALAPGATEVDISQMKVQVQNGTQIQTLDYASGGASATEFGATEIRDADGSYSTTTPVMSAGDLVRLDIALDLASLEFEPRDNVLVKLVPEFGTPIQVGFSTPASFGVNTVVELA